MRMRGYVCGQDLLVQKPDGGKIVIVESPGVNSVNERITGFEEAVANSGFEVIKRIESLGDSSNVKDEMTQVLNENSEIAAVMCGSGSDGRTGDGSDHRSAENEYLRV